MFSKQLQKNTSSNFLRMKVLLILLLAAFGNALENQKESYRVKASVLGKESIHDIILDPVENTKIVIVSDTSAHTRTVNLHDFNTGYLAYKELDSGRCFITKLEERYPSEERIQQYKSGRIVVDKISRYMSEEKESNPADVRKITGSNISNFCQSYKSYLMTKISSTKRAYPYVPPPQVDAFDECDCEIAQISMASRAIAGDIKEVYNPLIPVRQGKYVLHK